MLQTLIVFTAILALMTVSMSQAGMVSARMSYQRIARSYADVALTAATGKFLSYAQEEVRKNGPDALSMPVPADAAPSGTFNACSSDPIGSEPAWAQKCRFAVAVTDTVASSTQTSSGTSIAQGVQGQHILERRVSVAIDVAVDTYEAASHTVNAAAPVVTKARFITLRTFANAPFAALAGVRDLDSDIGSPDAGQGDSAGNNASDAGYADASDTGIHVRLDCKQGPNARGQTGTAPITAGSSLEGLPNAKGWAVEPPCDFSHDGVDNFNAKNWNAGTENTSGWSR